VITRTVLASTTLALLVGVSACTSGSAPAPSSAAPSTATRTAAPSTASQAPSTASPVASSPVPVSSAATSAATVSSCPLLTQDVVADTLGMRQGRIAVLRSVGKVVGCRFYALQHPNAQCDATCLAGEHLPGATQPALDIAITDYPTATAAHNAFVLASRAGTEASAVLVTGSITGVQYRHAFYPKDGAQDWAVAFSVGTRTVVVRAAEDDSADEVVSLAGRLAGKI
jgi:hypothetical protein